MGVLKKYRWAYLFAYGLMGVVLVSLVAVMVMFGCDSITNKMYSEVLGIIIAVLLCMFFPGCPLCYAFPEFKRNIQPAVVRMIIMSSFFWLLFIVFYEGPLKFSITVFYYIGPSSVTFILCIAMLFSFFGVYKCLFYRWFAGKKLSLSRF